MKFARTLRSRYPTDPDSPTNSAYDASTTAGMAPKVRFWATQSRASLKGRVCDTDPISVQQPGADNPPVSKLPVAMAAAALGLTIAWLIVAFPPLDAALRPSLQSVILGIVPVLTVATLLIRARVDRGMRAAWGLIAAGATCNLLATLPGIRAAQIPTVQSDLNYWFALACDLLLAVAAARMLLPSGTRERAARIDGAILIMASAAVLAAAWQPGVVWRAPAVTFLTIAWAVANLLLLSILGAATLSARFLLSPAGMLLWSGILLWGWSEMSVLNEQLADNPVEPGPATAAWLMGFALFAFAGVSPAQPSTGQEASRWSARVPAFSALLAGVILVAGLVYPVSTPASLLAVAALMLTVIRQFMNLAELDRAHRMHAEARTDELTGLLNRRGLYEALSLRLARQPNVTLLMVDLDEFKDINDSLGHQAGDEMLIIVADRLRRSCPPTADVARLGGDEFAIAVDGAADPESVAEAILATLREPAVVHNVAVRVSASIGMSCYPQHAGNLDELLRTADVAMYTAKRDRCVIFTYRAELDPRSREQLQLLAELRAAIPAGQLTVVYQPQCRLSDGAITSVEALLRWEHPTRGQLLPGMFIKQAEASGIICELTNFVLDRALSDMRTWLDAGADIDLSVNISGVDLARVDLPDVVSRALDRSDVAPERLTLELTETVMTSDSALAKRLVARLQALGVRISMDDFGIGFSSLAQALSLPLDEIKLDHSLIAAAKEAKGRAILRTAVRLARAMGASVVAEGVEDLRSLNFVRSIGVDYAQGYLISRPMACDDVPACAGTVPAAVATSLAVVSKPRADRPPRVWDLDNYRMHSPLPPRGLGPWDAAQSPLPAAVRGGTGGSQKETTGGAD